MRRWTRPKADIGRWGGDRHREIQCRAQQTLLHDVDINTLSRFSPAQVSVWVSIRLNKPIYSLQHRASLICSHHLRRRPVFILLMAWI